MLNPTAFTTTTTTTTTTDCQGHGSHCAGIAAGRSSGIARDANLYSIRVFGCSGGARVSTIINGLRAISAKHQENKDR